MRQIEKLINKYGESHQNKTNIWIHAIAVPSIYLVSIGLVWSIPVPEFIAQFNVNFAHIVA
ncbi:MAG: Mpo1-like protein, partial [Alteromonas sp.]